MNLRRNIAVAVFAAAFLSTAISQNYNSEKQTRTLTIEDAVKIANENNISLQRGQISRDATKRAKKYSWNSVSPSLSLGAGFSKNNQDFADNYSAYIQGGINFTLSTNLYTDIKNAALQYEAGEISYEAAKRAIELNVRTAFYNLLYLDENIALQENALKTALQQYQTNQRKYNLGAISQLDVLSSRVNYEKNIPQLQSAQIARENSMALFKQMLGISQSAEIELKGSLDEVMTLLQVFLREDDKIAAAKAFARGVGSKNLEVEALEKNLEIAKNSILASRFSAYGPVISAGWSYRPTWAKNGDVKTGPDDRGALSLSVTIPLDGLLPWSQRGLAIKTAKDKVSDLELQIQEKEISLQVEKDSAIRSIAQLVSTVQTLQSSVTLAETSYNMVSEAYGRGTRNFTELLSARDSLEQAKMNLKQQLYNLATSILKLEDNLGVPFGTLLK